MVPTKRIPFFEGETVNGVTPYQLKKVPTVKLTIDNKKYVIRLHPSTDEEIPTLHFLIKASGFLNPLFLQPLLDIATSPHQQQLLCASPFSTGAVPSNIDLLQQLASTYIPDLPNSIHPFQDVNMHLTAKINSVEIEKVHLQLRTANATYTYPHFCYHRKQHEIETGFIPSVPPSEIRMFLQWLLIRYTTFHLFQQPTTCKLLQLTAYNQYEDVPVHLTFEFLLLHWDNLCVQLTPTAESAPSESSPNICQLSYAPPLICGHPYRLRAPLTLPSGQLPSYNVPSSAINSFSKSKPTYACFNISCCCAKATRAAGA